MQFNLTGHPETINQTLMKDVVESDQCLVKVNNKYYTLATYQIHTTDPSINIEQGHWRIMGHNGNWDSHVTGWFQLPRIESEDD